MTSDEAGRLQELWKAKYGDKACSHSRMVECLDSDKENQAGYRACRECGAIYPDPLTELSQN